MSVKSCTQLGANAVAVFTPVHFWTACGAFHRRPPTGAAANGIPLKAAIPPLTTPDTRPPVTAALGICEYADEASSTSAATQRTAIDRFRIRGLSQSDNTAAWQNSLHKPQARTPVWRLPRPDRRLQHPRTL